MNKIMPTEVLQKDVDIYRKMLINPEYIDRLKIVDEIMDYLGIGTIALYYQYQIVLKQLSDYSYYEATILKRLKNEQYHNKVKRLSVRRDEKIFPTKRILHFSKKRS